MVVISMLRGINVGGHHLIKMDALRALYESLGLRPVQTYVQSGNVIFRTKDRNLAKLAKRIEDAIEKKFRFRPAVVLRTIAELRQAIGNNPFAERDGIEPNRLLVNFLAADPDSSAHANLQLIKADPEELCLNGRQLYIYFPNGIGRSKLPWAKIDKALKTFATGRNWNSVMKLLELAEKMDTG
jgi:uncharacterized protein (DUF1697 family)